MKKISIAIPAWEYFGLGYGKLNYSFQQIAKQTFGDFEVIVSDHSKDNNIEDLCKKWGNKFDIIYYRNEENRGSSAYNFNKAIELCNGEWIKFLCQDDYLRDENALQITNNLLNKDYNWVATGYIHTDEEGNFFNYHAPSLNPQLYVINTIGTPSCITIRNVNPMLKMDTNLLYAFDCEFYWRFMTKYGPPNLTTDVTVVNYLWKYSLTNQILNDELLKEENKYILEKHGIKHGKNKTS